MIKLRQWMAVAALTMLAVLIVTASRSGIAGNTDRLVLALRVLLVPLVITMGGVLASRAWGRWAALAAGLAVLPWSTAFVLTADPMIPLTPPVLALTASLALLGSLSGRAMVDHFEGETHLMALPSPLGRVVRWTVIGNVAAAIVLYFFVAAYEYRVSWRMAIPGLLLLGLVVGVLLLARGRTLGLVLVGGSCVLFVPAGGYFVWTEAASIAEAMLFIVAVLPGVVMGWVSVVVFGKPLWRFARAG
jgi:hypothetical protein